MEHECETVSRAEGWVPGPSRAALRPPLAVAAPWASEGAAGPQGRPGEPRVPLTHGVSPDGGLRSLAPLLGKGAHSAFQKRRRLIEALGSVP